MCVGGLLSPLQSAWSQETPVSGLKVGIGIDQGLGVTGQWQDFNGFIGIDAVAVDWLFARGQIPFEQTLFWYVGGGGFYDWDGEFGARLPLGAEMPLNERIDIYASIIPGFQVNKGSEFFLDVGLGIRYRF